METNEVQQDNQEAPESNRKGVKWSPERKAKWYAARFPGRTQK